LLGLSRPEAARFSFLMATPIIAGAGAWEGLKLVRGGSDVPVALGPLAVGMLAALVSGLLAIHFLLRFLTSHRLDVFVVYRIIVAAVVVIWFLAP
jgi:undecaprenyl-diphosphatase